jgi:hypothetical protein
MTTCANCVSDATYDYLGIKYCNSHLPRFLRKKDGTIAAIKIETEEAPPWVAPSADIVEVDASPVQVVEVLETTETAEPVQTEEVVKPAPKRRVKGASEAAAEPPVDETADPITAVDAPVEEPSAGE